MQLLSSTAGWVIELRLQAHAAARKKANARTVLVQRNVGKDVQINGQIFPTYDVSNLVGKKLLRCGGSYSNACAEAKQSGYTVLSREVWPFCGKVH